MQHPIITHINQAIELATHEFQQFRDLRYEKELDMLGKFEGKNIQELADMIIWCKKQEQKTLKLIDTLNTARNNANF